ncbi:uncharacterized protein LOC110100826 [Dendrobium catenatum]|nr:uncharacterized protein LOC110100826 [Dendrobium catenatum]XP_020684170.1 uncharacterized protein LOC110100826 [Dendrobium catenatum]XP_020684171.1 uncharacterized protein LOC110100826 [Dendrobium catenatum]XP_020684172.1 uncharacterized protein LOC110100826 [Dendrobium catenatum]XP_020684173.1 uncharacterized protein LOC110100826 [Dendrobium catenatum]XP_028554856.1 uncharacterized protein LOC110100826 [Dendrobium catenatum]XP_028554857.1 uncharacterized protein LOC110100826 [Dendrobium c
MSTISSLPSMELPTKSTSIFPITISTPNTLNITFSVRSNQNAQSISISYTRRRFPNVRKPTSSSLPDSFSPFVPKIRSLKSRLAAGETLYGLFLLSSSPTLAEIAGLAGYDYVVVDMEHGPGGISDALPCLRALASTGTAAVLRLPETSASWAKKALDLGPQGLMFPMIEDATAAELAISFCRFPPRGVRGSAHTVIRASAYGIDDSYLTCCEEDLLIMCQIESVTAASNIVAIAAVDGVDCLQMGPLDLSASMGYLCDPGNRKVRAMLREVERTVLALRKAGKEMASTPYLSGFAMPFDPPGDMKMRGYHMVAGAVDVGMFRKAAVEDVMRFRLTEAEIGQEDGDDDEERLS